MKLSTASVRSLEKILSEELAQCGLYLKLMSQEQDAVVALRADTVAAFSEKREAAVANLALLRDQRVALVSSLTDGESMSVTELIQTRCSAGDKKRLLALIEKLKKSIKAVESKSREFSQVLNFSMGLVNGSLSILRSANQSVAKGYNAFGSMTESLQPNAPRVGSSLGRA